MLARMSATSPLVRGICVYAEVDLLVDTAPSPETKALVAQSNPTARCHALQRFSNQGMAHGVRIWSPNFKVEGLTLKLQY
jgi:hypothetical protein